MTQKDSKETILVVDDSEGTREVIRRNLEGAGYQVLGAPGVPEAIATMKQSPVDLVITDLKMPRVSGMDLVRHVRENYPNTEVMMITGYATVTSAVEAVKVGADEYLSKPFTDGELLGAVRRSLAKLRVRRAGRESGGAVEAPHGLAGESEAMQRVFRAISKAATTVATVLVTGESGTGKELAARAIHYNSLRWNKSFAVQKCGSVPPEVLESELFGHKKGALPSAVQDFTGLFERTFGGTILLDEVCDLPPAFQVKLLRALQDGEIRPVGSTQRRKTDVRVLASSYKDLEAEVAAGNFRKDLFFHLAGVTVQLPPLSERREDIPLLANYLFKQSIEGLGKGSAGFTAETISCMKRYCWPGNVREMKNEIERMLVMGDEKGFLSADLLSPRILMSASPEAEDDLTLLNTGQGTLKERVEAIEAKILRESLIRHRWNKSKASRELGLSRVGLRGKLERYHVVKEDDKATGAPVGVDGE